MLSCSLGESTVIEENFIVWPNFRKLEMFHVGAKEKETWGEIANCFAHNSHCLVLSNDNKHTYADVMRALKTAMPNASDKMAQDLTELVDKEGRAILKVGVYKVIFHGFPGSDVYSF